MDRYSFTAQSRAWLSLCWCPWN